MKLNPHSKYLRFIFFFLLILWGVIGIFDFVNFYFDWNKPLAMNQTDTRMNSLNLLGPELPQRTEDEIRILALGDSVTIGLGTFYQEDWPSRMERKLREMGVAATVMNAGKSGLLNQQIYEAYQSLLYKKVKPDLIILYGSGNWVGYEMKQGDSDVLIKNTIPNFPNDLVPKKGKEEVRVEDNKSFFIPVLIKLLAYHSSFFAIIVKNLSSFNAECNYIFGKQIDTSNRANIEREIFYLAKIISLAKTTNTPIVIVKPFYLFKYEKFTNKFWNEFVKFKIDYSELPRIREQLSEVDMLYAKFANFAYILDPAEEILNHIHTNSDLSDAKKMMAGDYVHFSSFGNGIVGNYIGQNLINLGLVNQIYTQSWKHPSELIKDKNYEMDRRSQYLKYKNINLDFRNYNSYLFCLCLSLLVIIVFYLRAFFSLGVILTILGLFCLFSYGQYVENLQLPLRFLTVILLCIFSYRYFSSKFSIKRSFHFLAFLSFISILFFVNMNVFSVKLEKMNKFSDISSILRENIAWSEYIEFFARKLADHIFEMEDIKEDMYKFQIPMPYPLISNLRNNFLPLIFAPAIPAFFSSVFKFDSVEIFFLLASIPYIVLYLFYIRIINTVFISKLKYLLYPIGLIFIKQEIDFLFPIVFLIVTLTSLGIYSIYSPVKKNPVTRYLSALAFWPLYYLVIPETLLLLGLVCVYFFLMEFYQNSFSLWSSMQNTFLWICVLFIPKLFILMLPSSKVNLDYMIQYNLLPKTFHLHSVYSFLAALTVLLFAHANRERLKVFKRKILQGMK